MADFWTGRTSDPAAPTFARHEASLGEIASAAYENMVLVDNSISSTEARERAYDDTIAEVKELTGEALENPYRVRAWPEPDELKRLNADRAAGIDTDLLDLRRRAFGEKLSDLARRRPQQREQLLKASDIDARATRTARQAGERLGQAMESRPGLGKYGAAFAGGVPGALRDPLQLATLVVGGGPGAARTIGGRIARTALSEALVNGVAEAALQPAVQAWRQQIGLPNGWEEALTNVGFAAVLGGTLGAAGRGIAEMLPAPVRAAQDDGEAAAAMLEPIRDGLPAETRGALDALEAERLTQTADSATDPATGITRTASPPALHEFEAYHGTMADFERFADDFLGSETEAASARQGHFFARDPEVAASYAVDDNWYREGFLAKLLPQKALDIYGAMNDRLLKLFGHRGLKREGRILRTRIRFDNPKIIDRQGVEFGEGEIAGPIAQAKAEGHDGVIFRNARDPGYDDAGDVPTDIFVVFDPGKIDILSRHADAAQAAQARGTSAAEHDAAMTAALKRAEDPAQLEPRPVEAPAEAPEVEGPAAPAPPRPIAEAKGIDDPAAPEVAVAADETIAGLKAAADAARTRRIVRAIAGPAPKPVRKPGGILRWLAARGGIREFEGELANRDLGKLFVPGFGKLVRKGGVRMDYAREAAAEMGYFPQYGDIDAQVSNSTVHDLLALIDAEMRGETVMSRGNEDDFAEWQAYQAAREERATIRDFVGKVDALAERNLPDTIVEDAARRMAASRTVHGEAMLEADDALEQAIMADHYLEADAPRAMREGEEFEADAIPFFERLPGDGREAAPGRTGDAGEEGTLRADRGELRAAGADPRSEAGAEGKDQLLIEGVEPVRQADRDAAAITAGAAAPLRGGNREMDFGLFGPEVDQADMMDLIVPVGARADAEGRMVAETVTLDDALADAAKLGDVAFLLRNCKA